MTVQSGLFGSLASTNRNISLKWIRIKWITHVQVLFFNTWILRTNGFTLSSNFAIKWILCFTKWIPFLFQMTFNICNTWNLYVQVKSGFLQWSEVETCYGFSVI